MNHPTPDDLVDFIHGAFPPEEDARVHVHLAACEPCRLAYREEVSLGETLRREARAGERELPDLVRARIMQAVRAESRSSRSLRAFPKIFAVPVAAAILFAASLALPTFSPAPPTAIDAQYYLDAHKAQSAGNPLAEHSGPTALFNAAFGERSSDVIR